QRRLVARCIESGQTAGNVDILDPAQQVPLAEDGRQPASQLSQAQGLATKQHLRQAWLPRQLTQSSAVFAQCPTAATALKGTQLNQQVPALLQGGGGRWVEPDQFSGIVHTPARQLQCQRRQIGLQDLRRTLGHQLGVLIGGPQAIADTRLGTAGASCPPPARKPAPGTGRSRSPPAPRRWSGWSRQWAWPAPPCAAPVGPG